MNPMLTRIIATVLPLVAFGAHAADTRIFARSCSYR